MANDVQREDLDKLRIAHLEQCVDSLEQRLKELYAVTQEAVSMVCATRERDQRSIHNLSERMTREAHAVRDLIDEMRGIDTRDLEPEPPPGGPVLH